MISMNQMINLVTNIPNKIVCNYIHDTKYVYYKNGDIFSKHKKTIMKSEISNRGYKRLNLYGKKKSAHRVLYEKFKGVIPDGIQVDHINNIKTDNRLQNLQLLLPRDNSLKKSIQSNNTSGFRGVNIRKKGIKRFKAEIAVNGKSVRKSFLTLNEAISHRIMWEIKYSYPCIV